MNGGFAPGPRARPRLQVSRCRRFERAKNQGRSFGVKATVRPCGMATGFAQRVREGRSVNSFASNLVAPTIETFLSGARLRLSSVVDLPDVYRESSTIEERRSRIAGNRLEIKDLRIDNKAIGTNWTGVAKREGREFRAAHPRRRGASRRSR